MAENRSGRELTYRSAGVDVVAGYKSVELMKKHVNKTFTPEVLGGLGGFGGAFSIEKAKNMDSPVLISGTDGVGTKLKIAFIVNKHDTIGIDCVAMCVNDIVCVGAQPLYFLDYIACGKNRPEKIEQIVKGVADGCFAAGCALIGGETAEMPGFYDASEYDLAGFAVGIVDKAKMFDNSKISEGDAIIGLASSGLHSNGFSLVRKIFRPSENNIGEFVSELGRTLGEELLIPTKIYVKSILNLMENIEILGASHITGGGFTENIPRSIPEGLCAAIHKGTWNVLPIFKLLKETASLSEEALYGTFNMGIGMTVIVRREEAAHAVALLKESGESAFVIGEIEKGSGVKIV